MSRKLGKAIRVSFAWIDKGSIFFGYVSASCVISLTLIVFISVIARYIFNRPFAWSDEISAYIFLSHCLLALAYATYREAHVAVEMLLVHFPPRVQFVINLVGYILALMCIAVVMYYGLILFYQYFIQGWHSDTEYAFILWPFVMMVPLGFLMFGLQCFSRINAIVERRRRSDNEKGELANKN